MIYTVYILKTSGNTLYTGQTNNLEKRLKEHNSKTIKSAKYTRCFDNCELFYKEEYSTRGEAMKREAEIKRMTRAQKEKLGKW
jgi:putative endonuclease